MEKALKAKWIEALRSGKYKQGRGMLRSFDDKYCCLGVLCDIGGQGEWRQAIPMECYVYTRETEDNGLHLPPFMKKFTGLTLDTQLTLVAKNDAAGLSFNEMADWIEVNIKEDQ